MVATIRTDSQTTTFKPAWEQEESDPKVAEPGPLQLANPRHQHGAIDVRFQMDATHLTAHMLEEGRSWRIALRCLNKIDLVNGELRLDMHLPLPITRDGKHTAVRAIYGHVTDGLETARWTWLGSKHSRSAGECPYCFKSALDIEPQDGQLLPTENGSPVATVFCRGCERDFTYDYVEGAFQQKPQAADEPQR